MSEQQIEDAELRHLDRDEPQYRPQERIAFTVLNAGRSTQDTSGPRVRALGLALGLITIAYSALELLNMVPNEQLVVTFVAMGLAWIAYAVVAILAAGYSNRGGR